MSKTVHISSTSQFNTVLENSKIVIADFYADWCGPCKTIAPLFEQLSAQLSRPKNVSFVKINVENQQEIASMYQVTAMPTFLIFKDKQIVEKLQGADGRKLSSIVKQHVADHPGSSSQGEASGSGMWLGAELPRGYSDVTDQVDMRGLDLLNSDSDFGTSRTLFDGSKPSALEDRKGKSAAKDGKATKDWVETDTDEQLMLYIPFHSTLKIHTLFITSHPPKSDEETEDIPMKPKTIRIYSNRAHVLGFEEAEDIPATQAITLAPQDWNEKTGTAKIELRFVKFQNVTSLVIFIVDGDGSGEKVRVDRLRIIGETGEKRDLGKLEKVDQSGE